MGQYNNPARFILAWPPVEHYKCITGAENDKSKKAITSLYMYMLTNLADGNLHRPRKTTTKYEKMQAFGRIPT